MLDDETLDTVASTMTVGALRGLLEQIGVPKPRASHDAVLDIMTKYRPPPPIRIDPDVIAGMRPKLPPDYTPYLDNLDRRIEEMSAERARDKAERDEREVSVSGPACAVGPRGLQVEDHRLVHVLSLAGARTV